MQEIVTHTGAPYRSLHASLCALILSRQAVSNIPTIPATTASNRYRCSGVFIFSASIVVAKAPATYFRPPSDTWERENWG